MSSADKHEPRAVRIHDTVSDLVGSFLYYDRKEDEDLPRGAIEAAIKAGELTAENIVDWFRVKLTEGLAQECIVKDSDALKPSDAGGM